jgi:hypothetical protein
VKPERWLPGPSRSTSIAREGESGNPGWGVNVSATKIYTPSAEIPQALRKAVQDSIRDGKYQVRADTIQPRLIGGRQALSWYVDYREGPTSPTFHYYYVAIRSETSFVEAYANGGALTRWYVDPAIEAIRLP